MGEILGKYVVIDEMLGDYAAFDFFFKDKAWDKIYRCLVGLGRPRIAQRRLLGRGIVAEVHGLAATPHLHGFTW